jgi:hypothetical protein
MCEQYIGPITSRGARTRCLHQEWDLANLSQVGVGEPGGIGCNPVATLPCS